MTIFNAVLSEIGLTCTRLRVQYYAPEPRVKTMVEDQSGQITQLTQGHGWFTAAALELNVQQDHVTIGLKYSQQAVNSERLCGQFDIHRFN